MRIGSLFSGFGGLEMSTHAVLGGSLAWVCDNDPAASKVLAHHWPGVPNLGDVAAVDWSTVERVDVLTGGFPCTDVSHAGKRAGLTADTRSGLWAHMATAVDRLRPPLVVIENVRGLLSAKAARGEDATEPEPDPLWQYVEDDDAEAATDPAGDDLGSDDADLGDDDDPGHVLLRALGAVLGDLADLGYDAVWTGVRAADVGAPHGRFRVFVLAWPESGDTHGEHREGWATAGLEGEAGSAAGSVGHAQGLGRQRGGFARLGWSGPASAGPDAPHADQSGLEGPQPAGRRVLPDRGAAAYTESDGRDEGRPEPTGFVGGPDAAECGADAAPEGRCRTCGDPEWMHDEGGFCAGSCGGECTDPELGRPDDAAPHADGHALRQQPVGEPGSGGASIARHAGAAATPDASLSGCSGLKTVDCPESPGDERHPDGLGMASRGVDWGAYAPAIARWERVLGRPAPAPTEPGATGQPRLSALAVEFLMGLPPGWVTDVPGISRNDMLRLLGNGVVPQHGEAAIRHLLAAAADALAVAS